MSSNSTNITELKEIIRNKKIFSLNDGIYISKKLVYLNTFGKECYWMIKVGLFESGNIKNNIKISGDMIENKLNSKIHAFISAEYGQLNGKDIKTTPSIVTEGKNIGRKNETNVLLQALRDAYGKYNKHIQNIHIIKNDDEAVYFPPMLAKELSKDTITDYSKIFQQKKFNGIRAVSRLNDVEEVEFYSRKSKMFPKKHEKLYAEVSELFAAASKINMEKILGKKLSAADILLFKTVYFDGELYLHNVALQDLSGSSRNKDSELYENYMIYDCFFPMAKKYKKEVTAEQRQKILNIIFEGKTKMKFVKQVENFYPKNEKELTKLNKKFLNEGYEGSIIRLSDENYQYSFNNYHSSVIFKFKPLFDAEYECVGFTEGKKGKERGAIIWICKISKDGKGFKLFDVVPKGMTYNERYDMFTGFRINVDLFTKYLLGKNITVEYRDISKDKIPLQAKALRFRTEDDPDEKQGLLDLVLDLCRKVKKPQKDISNDDIPFIFISKGEMKYYKKGGCNCDSDEGDEGDECDDGGDDSDDSDDGGNDSGNDSDDDSDDDSVGDSDDDSVGDSDDDL